jgi:hypothetical protein
MPDSGRRMNVTSESCFGMLCPVVVRGETVMPFVVLGYTTNIRLSLMPEPMPNAAQPTPRDGRRMLKKSVSVELSGTLIATPRPLLRVCEADAGFCAETVARKPK